MFLTRWVLLPRDMGARAGKSLAETADPWCVMRHRNLSRDEALEEYLIYRKRVRELLDMTQISRDIRGGKYEPRDFLGRGPARFSHAVGSAIMGLFASLLDPQKAALNVFDVWLALFPERKDKINHTWELVKPHIQLIRNYRNDIACHANKSIRRQAATYLNHHKYLGEVVKAMRNVSQLAADLMRDEATALPNLRAEIEPIMNRALAPLVRNLGPSQQPEVLEALKTYFFQEEPKPKGGKSGGAARLG